MADQSLDQKTADGTLDDTDLLYKLATEGEDQYITGAQLKSEITNATSINAAGAVMESDYNANTILYATNDNTPAALTVDEQTLVGRITGGEIADLSTTQIRTLINVEDGSEANTIDSDPTGVTGADQVTNVMSLTTAEYATIGTPDAATLYVITDA